ncbi:MAG: pyridoxal phosphate-dependent aminotransferase, partial [Verrucomicrobiota bacterium]
MGLAEPWVDGENSGMAGYEDLVCERVLRQPVYEPGRPISEVARAHGLRPEAVAKLASNENPLGCSPRAREAAVAALGEARLYPDGGGYALIERLVERHGLPRESFVLGNGSNEIIELLGHAFLDPGAEVVFGAHAFIVYKLVALLFGAQPVEVPMPGLRHDLDAMRAAITERTRLVFLPSPNNPTGTANSAAEITAFVRSLPPHVVFCLDEAYAEYQDNPPDLRP